jgi:ParB-like chromosome segregation protein Spo0J
LQAERVREISESIRQIGLKTPVTVRPLAGGNVVLVTGLHRLEAAKLLGWDSIDAVCLDGDERHARLWQISENLHRADLTVLERDEQIAEWLRLIADKGAVSGQVVQKTRSGRPEGGLSRAARRLPVPGSSEEARRKLVERAIRVDSISPEAKAAATSIGLANNQAALLAVAKEPTARAQVEKVRELANRKPDPRAKRAGLAERRAGGEAEGDRQSPVEQRSPAEDANFIALKAAWLRASELVHAWTNSPWPVRDRFILEVRAPNHALQPRSTARPPRLVSVVIASLATTGRSLNSLVVKMTSLVHTASLGPDCDRRPCGLRCRSSRALAR